MKILHLLDTPHFAGTERHILTLAGTTERYCGARTSIVCRYGSPLQQAAAAEGIQTLPLFEGKNILSHVANLMTPPIREAAILHCHNGRTLLSASLLSPKKRGPVVYTQHFLDPGFHSHPAPIRALYRLGHKIANRRVAHFIAVSEEAKRRMVEREVFRRSGSRLSRTASRPICTGLRNPIEVRREVAFPRKLRWRSA